MPGDSLLDWGLVRRLSLVLFTLQRLYVAVSRVHAQETDCCRLRHLFEGYVPVSLRALCTWVLSWLTLPTTAVSFIWATTPTEDG